MEIYCRKWTVSCIQEKYQKYLIQNMLDEEKIGKVLENRLKLEKILYVFSTSLKLLLRIFCFNVVYYAVHYFRPRRRLSPRHRASIWSDLPPVDFLGGDYHILGIPMRAKSIKDVKKIAREKKNGSHCVGIYDGVGCVCKNSWLGFLSSDEGF